MAQRPAPPGVVLAGGRATRLPGKPLAALAGVPLISYPVEALREAGVEPVIAAKVGDQELRGYADSAGARILDEPQDPVHPLFGVAHALQELERPVVVVAADMPFVPAALLAHLSAQTPAPGGATVVEAGGRLEPLLGCYDPGALDHLRAAVDAGAPAQRALRSLGPLLTVIGEAGLSLYGDPERIVRDVDDDAALTAAEIDLA
ncbi:MAG: NTP transferase domain-containing protein [Baekduia sp.]